MTKVNEEKLLILVLLFMLVISIVAFMLNMNIISINDSNQKEEQKTGNFSFFESNDCRAFGFLQYNSTHCIIGE